MTEQQNKKIIALLTEALDLLKLGSSTLDDGGGEEKAKTENMKWENVLKKKQPKNDYERIALIVNRLATQENSVSVEDIIEFIRIHPNDFSNVTEKSLKIAIIHTKNNKYYGYIEFANKKKKGYYRLSVKGFQLINTLPDRPKK